MQLRALGLIGYLAFAFALSCAGTPAQPAIQSASAGKLSGNAGVGAPVPKGDLRRSSYLQFAVYYHATQTLDAMEFARGLVKEEFHEFKLVSELEQKPVAPELMLFDPPYDEYAPPANDVLDTFGRGFETADVKKLRDTNRVVAFQMVAPASSSLMAQHAALKLTAKLAAKLDGFAWDEVTREVFTQTAWQERVQQFALPIPNIKHHITMHFYRANDSPRLITLGMGKFGLPDIVIERLPASSARPFGTLVNLVCQTLLERGRLEYDGQLDIDLRTVRNVDLRNDIERTLLAGATGRAKLDLTHGVWQEGDPTNRLIEIAFPGLDAELFVRQEALLTQLFGSADRLIQVQHDEELEAASERARKELLELKPKFHWESTEVLLVKAPFKTPSGNNEWMWVEVTRWDGTQIQGVLQNDPFEVPNLRAGARVSFDESVVFDYIHKRDDGSEVGNETGKILDRLEREGRAR